MTIKTKQAVIASLSTGLLQSVLLCCCLCRATSGYDKKKKVIFIMPQGLQEADIMNTGPSLSRQSYLLREKKMPLRVGLVL